MTLRRKCILWIWIASIVLMGLYPPWVADQQSLGYSFLFGTDYGHVDTTRLFLGWRVATAMASVFYFAWTGAMPAQVVRGIAIGLVATFGFVLFVGTLLEKRYEQPPATVWELLQRFWGFIVTEFACICVLAYLVIEAINKRAKKARMQSGAVARHTL